MLRTQEFFAFIKERHLIHTRRAAGLARPWTDDKILQSYRFCNVYRELDTQTIWLANNWRKTHGDNADFWFAALVFRHVNWHETCVEIGVPLPWDPEQFIDVLQDRKRLGMKCYSGAYMISTHNVREEKATYLGKSLSKIWARRGEVRYVAGERLAAFHSRLLSCFDVGTFLSAQVIADAKYTRPFADAADWWTFAASGPGSRRGLNRILGRDVKTPWEEDAWRNVLLGLKCVTDKLALSARMPRMCAQDLQNCLCEFDKYERVRLGEGRPKSKYNGAGETP